MPFKWRLARAQLAWVVALLCTVAGVWAVARVPLGGLGGTLRGAAWPWLAAAVLAHVAIQPIGAWQWRLVLPESTPPVRWRDLLRLFALGAVANNTASSLVGHAAGTAMVAALPGVGSARAVTLLALDQLCVGVAKLAVLLVASQLVAVPLAGAAVVWPAWMAAGVRGIALAVGVLALLAVIVAPALARRTAAGRALPRLHPRVDPLVQALAGAVANAMAAVPLTRVMLAAGCAVVVKLCEAVGIAAVQLAFGVPVSPLSVALVLAATTVATLVPVMPANLGTYEASVFAALTAVGVTPELAVAVALAQHGAQLVAAVVPGVLVAWSRAVA